MLFLRSSWPKNMFYVISQQNSACGLFLTTALSDRWLTNQHCPIKNLGTRLDRCWHQSIILAWEMLISIALHPNILDMTHWAAKVVNQINWSKRKICVKVICLRCLRVRLSINSSWGIGRRANLSDGGIFRAIHTNINPSSNLCFTSRTTDLILMEQCFCPYHKDIYLFASSHASSHFL